MLEPLFYGLDDPGEGVRIVMTMGAGCSGFMVGCALWGEAARASTVIGSR